MATGLPPKESLLIAPDLFPPFAALYGQAHSISSQLQGLRPRSKNLHRLGRAGVVALQRSGGAFGAAHGLVDPAL